MAEMLSDFGHIIGLNGSTQVAVMPTYSTVAVGTIVQYIGATDTNYTNGYFYKATASGWEVVDVQGEDTDKADKVASATAGNLAGLNASGNLTDAGWSADKTTTSATGNPISISGLKSNQLAINPVITLEPIQAGSGDPSPSNIRAISGYDKIEVLSLRKNLLKNQFVTITETNGTISADSNGVITINGTFDHQHTCMVVGQVTAGNDNLIFTSGGDWLWNRDGIALDVICVDDPTIYWGSANNQEIPGNHTYEIHLGQKAGTYNNVKIYPMVRDASITDSTYEPYNPITNIQLQLGETIYGGTLDVEKGILTVDRGMIDLGSVDAWHKNADSGCWYGGDIPTTTGGSNVALDGVCSKYKCISGDETYQGTQGISRWSTDARICVYDSAMLSMSSTEVKTYLTGTILVYRLATPYTIQLTPHEISLLKDYAYVSTNGTNIQFSYHNGEMASLGDVESLGKTMNLLGDVVDSKIQITEDSTNPIQITIHLKNGNSLSFMSLFGNDLKYGTVVNNTWSGWKNITATD